MKRRIFYGLLIFLAFPLLFFLSTEASQNKTELKAPRTPIPCLYENWKKATVGETGTDEQARTKAEGGRQRFSGREDPFCRVMKMTESERKQNDEWILWENGEILVLADKFNWQKPLVVPKTHMVFPFEAKKELLHQLAIVAAFTSDGIGQSSESSQSLKAPSSRIYISPPDAIGVGHLHIHVQPQGQINAPNKAEFDKQISSYLKQALANLDELSQNPITETKCK